MRKLLTISLVLMLVLVLGACGGRGGAIPEPTKRYSEDQMSQWEDSIEQKLTCSSLILFSEEDDELSITLEAQDITYFGNAVIEGRAVCKDVFENEPYSFSVWWRNDKLELEMSFVGASVDLYGLLVDRRSGEDKYTYLKNEADLVEIFPASREYTNRLDLDPDDLAIYDAVWEVLNEDYNRPENEILEELAPQYDMTAEELKQFMRDMMEKVLS